jgi:FixJ family two-component response regulator
MAIKQGAVDFLTKPVDDEKLLFTIKQALATHYLRIAQQDTLKTIRQCEASLTKREREVMQYVIAGALNKQIAFELGIVEKTVKVHRGHVMEKMQVSSVAELVRACALLGIEPRNLF